MFLVTCFRLISINSVMLFFQRNLVEHAAKKNKNPSTWKNEK